MLKKLLNIFHQLSAIISKTNDYELMLSQFVDVLAEGLEVDVCSVYFYDKTDDELILKASHGLNPESINNVKMAVSEGLTGLCFSSEKMINIVNPDKHPRFKYFLVTGEEQYKSFLATPIVSGKEKLGVIVIQGKSSKRFRKSVTDSMRSISLQLANVIMDATVISTLGQETDNRENTVEREKSLSGMLSIKGHAANIGIGIGKACLFDNEVDFERVIHKEVDDTNKEVLLFQKAVKVTKDKTLALEEKALELISEADASIFCAHLLFLEDNILISKIINDIIKNEHAAEFSIKVIFNEYHERFSAMDSNIFKEKIMDLKDVMLRLLNVVKDLKRGVVAESEEIEINNSKAVLVVKEILPSALIRLPVENICGIVCEKGGVADHVAILAKALNIPAIRGIKNVTEIVNDSDDIIVDGQAEYVHIRPDDILMSDFKNILHSQKDAENSIELAEETVTTDGVKFSLKANIALISETSLLKRYGAEGIGLYRTEFLYMIRDHEPTEEEQFNIFKRIIQNSEDLEVTIRVLDIGGDKPLPYIENIPEENPALGNRGIRLLLENRPLFKTHLRAILRAGALGKIKLLFPMVSCVSEVDSILEVISDVETELQVSDIEFSDDYKIGIMLEVPALLFELDSLLERIDFVSLGTNDLVQYIFASDRTNELTYKKNLYLSPVFLKILRDIGNRFKEYKGKNISICGEMGSDIYALPLLLATGINEFSMTPRFIPKMRKIIRAVSHKEACELFDKVILLKTPDQVHKLVLEFYISKFGKNFTL